MSDKKPRPKKIDFKSNHLNDLRKNAKPLSSNDNCDKKPLVITITGIDFNSYRIDPDETVMGFISLQSSRTEALQVIEKQAFDKAVAALKQICDLNDENCMEDIAHKTLRELGIE